jgi:uncharacterized membrane protein YfcA
MTLDLDVALAGLIIGFCIGLTGMGGGALMTPVMVLGFGVQPSAAVSSDIVASAVMKPFGSAVHFHRGNVHLGLVGWLALGSVPAAFAGVFVNRALGDGAAMQQRIQYAMGGALLIATAAIVVKVVLERLRGSSPEVETVVVVRRLATVTIGIVGGLLVGMTSVGAGTVVIVLLMLAYPDLPMRQIVGTDLVQAIPLVASAAVSHAIFGDLQFALTTALTAGGVIGVILGALLSSRAPNRLIRPALAFLLLASALKLLDVPTRTVGAVLAVVAVAGLAGWIVTARRRASAVEPRITAPAPRPQLAEAADVAD